MKSFFLRPALGILELASIARGVQVSDAVDTHIPTPAAGSTELVGEAPEDAVPLEHEHALAPERGKDARGCETADPGADDDGVVAGIAGHLGIIFESISNSKIVNPTSEY